jgi:hypothetical protein
METIINTIGIIGVIFCILAFFLTQAQKISANDLTFILLNLFGAIMIMFSLFFFFNLASFVIEVAWVLISLYGLWRYWRKKKH